MTDSPDAAADTATAACPMVPEPLDQHRWLHRMIGDWAVTMTMPPNPDGSPGDSHSGQETVRPLGDLWVIGDGTAEGGMRSQIALGYDPVRGRFVGTFLASMMTHLWIYEGTLDETGTVLTLEAVGPLFDQPDASARYQDIITLDSPDRRRLSSRLLMSDGRWVPVMSAEYRRLSPGT